MGQDTPFESETTKSKHYPASPVFLPTHVHVQKKKYILYGVAWSSDYHRDKNGKELQYVATAGANNQGQGSTITIYEVEVKTRKGGLMPVQQYTDKDKKEQYFACAFAGRSNYLPTMTAMTDDAMSPDSSECDTSEKPSEQDSSSASNGHESNVPPIVPVDSCVETNYLNNVDNRFDSGRGPKLLCAGGVRNVIKVIDLLQKKTIQILRGHNHEVYDLKCSPVDENLLLSCSVDETIRIWDLISFSCVVRFAGVHGHSREILSVAWHPSGQRFASSGSDASIRLWNMHDGRIQEALYATRSVLRSGQRPVFLEHPFPYFVTKKVHKNIVDCVHFCGDMILSKSSYDSIILWQPKEVERTSCKIGSATQMPPDEVIVLRTFSFEHGGSLWFHRFTVDPTCRLMAIGNTKGEVYVWSLDTERDPPHRTRLERDPPDRTSVSTGSSRKRKTHTIRNIAFSPRGSVLVACTDIGEVYRLHQEP